MTYLEARDKVNEMRRTNQVPSWVFGPIYEFVLGIKYKHSSCGPCMKQKLDEVFNRINQHFDKLKVEEIITDEVSIEEIEVKPIKKNKKSPK